MELSLTHQSSGGSTRLPFDVGRIATPVSANAPAGQSLRYDGTYDEIRAARTGDDPGLSRGVWVAPLRRASWTRVEALCLEALERRSKDLQLAAWLTEAWVHLNGFAGLRDGLRVQATLCESFWKDVHPRSDTGDLEYHFAPFIWMGEKLPFAISCIPVSRPDSADVEAYCWADWQVACRNGDGDPTGFGCSQTAFQQSMTLTPVEFYVDLQSEIDDCLKACSALGSMLERRCGVEAPSLGSLSKVLFPIREFVGGILTERHVPMTASRRDMGESPDQDVSPALPPTYSSTQIQNRADAYRWLGEAADYLARTEPHSPAPYLVRRAIKWGGMQLTDLLPELVRSGDELNEICRLLQIGGQ